MRPDQDDDDDFDDIVARVEGAAGIDGHMLGVLRLEHGPRTVKSVTSVKSVKSAP